MNAVLKLAAVAAVCSALAVGLLLASRIGERSRCAWLTAHNSPASQTYDCNTTGAR